MLRIEYCAAQRQGKEIEEILNEMEEKEIYLSFANKQRVKFWREADGRETLENISV